MKLQSNTSYLENDGLYRRPQNSVNCQQVHIARTECICCYKYKCNSITVKNLFSTGHRIGRHLSAFQSYTRAKNPVDCNSVKPLWQWQRKACS